MGGRDQRGEHGQHRFFRPAQQPGDGCVDHQCQREEEPVEKLRPGAAHLADDHLALSKQKAPGETCWVSLEVQAKVRLFSLCVAFDEGKTRLEFKMGLVSGEKTTTDTPFRLIVCES
ncbi:ethanolaminephosphotransferase 1-like [Grus japonensis]|uniref:Ethanolaminephosphotransferase 1-like n=1 Tax=Grus japonensis TaxID=30415 RepID=A0ABC9WAE3_GRUJA